MVSICWTDDFHSFYCEHNLVCFIIFAYSSNQVIFQVANRMKEIADCKSISSLSFGRSYRSQDEYVTEEFWKTMCISWYCTFWNLEEQTEFSTLEYILCKSLAIKDLFGYTGAEAQTVVLRTKLSYGHDWSEAVCIKLNTPRIFSLLSALKSLQITQDFIKRKTHPAQ